MHFMGTSHWLAVVGVRKAARHPRRMDTTCPLCSEKAAPYPAGWRAVNEHFSP